MTFGYLGDFWAAGAMMTNNKGGYQNLPLQRPLQFLLSAVSAAVFPVPNHSLRRWWLH